MGAVNKDIAGSMADPGDDFFAQFGGTTQLGGAGSFNEGFGPGTGGQMIATGEPSSPYQATGGGLQGDAAFDEFGRGLVATGGKTVADLQAYVAQWNQQHPESPVTLGGSKGDKVYGPNGEFWNDAVISAGLGGQGLYWGPKGGGAGGGGVNAGEFGSLAKGWEGQFNAPSIDEIRNMPGYQFALQEGIKGLDTAAAAKGTALAGGQKKNILQYATGLLDQTAQQKYQNALGEYMNQYSIFRNNQNDVFDRFNTLASRGTTAAGSATS